MSWREQIIEKGMRDKIRNLMKKMKDASFKRKIENFLRENLDIKYKAGKGSYKTRVTGKEEALEQAKKLLLEIVEESFDNFFEYTFSEEVFTGSPALNPDYIPMDGP
jgi:hypothetical protein